MVVSVNSPVLQWCRNPALRPVTLPTEHHMALDATVLPITSATFSNVWSAWSVG